MPTSVKPEAGPVNFDLTQVEMDAIAGLDEGLIFNDLGFYPHEPLLGMHRGVEERLRDTWRLFSQAEMCREGFVMRVQRKFYKSRNG